VVEEPKASEQVIWFGIPHLMPEIPNQIAYSQV